MIASVPDFIAELDLDGRVQFLNHYAEGFSEENVLGVPMVAFVPEAYRQRAIDAMREAIETRETVSYGTLGARRPGEIRHYLNRMIPVVEDGAVDRLILVGTDVTDRLETETFNQLVVETTGMGIWTLDPAIGSGTMDATTREIFGVTRENDDHSGLQEMLARHIHPEDAERVSASIEQAFQTGNYGPLQHRLYTSEGALRWVSASGRVTRAEDGRPLQLIGSIVDITAQKTLEARLLEAEKLESIGRLAGGIAHDFNNMLTTIRGNLALASEAAADGDDTAPFLQEIQIAAERSSALTAQLLAFARRQVIEPHTLDPNALVERLDALLRRVLGEDVAVDVALGSTASIRVDPSQFEQVLLNLVTNARDAMPAGGSLVLRTDDVQLDTAHVLDHPGAAAGPHVRIAVSDTGSGIASEHLPRVFEPFFTTRDSGTGLGLATCHGIVRQNGGHITVESTPGTGTTFAVFLPAHARSDTQSPVESRDTRPDTRPHQTVLVVEDEPMVLRMVEITLKRAGYDVVGMTDPVAALAWARERTEPIDLLVTDVVMPGLRGPALAAELAKRWTPLEVLFISGYPQDEIGKDGVIEKGTRFLQKPFLPDDLLAALRLALEA